MHILLGVCYGPHNPVAATNAVCRQAAPEFAKARPELTRGAGAESVAAVNRLARHRQARNPAAQKHTAFRGSPMTLKSNRCTEGGLWVYLTLKPKSGFLANAAKGEG